MPTYTKKEILSLDINKKTIFGQIFIEFSDDEDDKRGSDYDLEISSDREDSSKDARLKLSEHSHDISRASSSRLNGGSGSNEDAKDNDNGNRTTATSDDKSGSNDFRKFYKSFELLIAG